ncbi:MAG: hypothetical protein AAF560_29075, partial [Acidobacteriota bacterium]
EDVSPASTSEEATQPENPVARLAQSLAKVKDKEALRQTVADQRQVGIAMMSYMTDAVRAYAQTEEGAERSKKRGELADRHKYRELAALGQEESKQYQSPGPMWTVRKAGVAEDRGNPYTIVSYDRVVEALVPKYLDEVPRVDGWGHPYEFAINEDLLGISVLGIRSPGRDGEFDTDDYVVGPYNLEAYDRDPVWVDGFFGRWPQKAGAPAR